MVPQLEASYLQFNKGKNVAPVSCIDEIYEKTCFSTGSRCRSTNVADATFAAYFVHYISAVDGWELVLFVALEPTNGVRRVEENTNRK